LIVMCERIPTTSSQPGFLDDFTPEEVLVRGVADAEVKGGSPRDAIFFMTWEHFQTFILKCYTEGYFYE
jgi:hypothetical protein